jgi:lauroyl/myristoyl acyltransferase
MYEMRQDLECLKPEKTTKTKESIIKEAFVNAGKALKVLG